MERMKTRTIKKDVAIIGMSGKFPKSDNISEFWENLIVGNELIHFYSDSELEKLGVNPDLIKKERYVKSSALLEDSSSFDYSFFRYSKEEAELMDPQIRILHEQAWLALEDSGYNPFNYTNKIGSFFTAGHNINWMAHVKLLESSDKVNQFFIDHVSDSRRISTLISYALNLKGPSYFIDTACSSSLVAIHVACRNLLMKECAMAVAGGVNIGSSKDIGYVYEEGMIFSKDGHCKAFDIDSSGTFGGEGVGVVVLKRLEDALNDRDHIYSVIRSSSVNNDGNRKVGYTAPSIIGQYECIKSALQIAEVDPTSISYIETHGTGTKLGDPVEIEALNKAFNYNTAHQCGIGSVKTNMGHLDTAAGVAGLIKTALSLENKIIPPSLHFKTPNPEINFKSGPFYVNSELKEWSGKKPLLAGVNSLGIGGTNVHMILEEPPIQQKGSLPKEYQLLVYSAKTKASLERYHNNLNIFLKNNKNIDLADLSYTLKVGRNNFKYRRFITCRDVSDARSQFESTVFQETFQVKEKKRIVFMFAGQGSQYFKMGKEIYSKYPYFKNIIDQGFEILKNDTGIDYANIIGYSDSEESESESINDLRFSIPLLFLVEYAFAKLLLKLGVNPSNMIGHSFGEYVAACLSEVFTFEEGIKLIVKRAHLMSGMEKGSMVSVDMPVDKISEFMFSELSIAAVNTENSCVVSGNTKSIDSFCDLLSSKEITFLKIRTSHAGHSQMMDSIMSAFESEVKKINLSEPKFPFISCITGRPIKKEEATSPKYWLKHLRETVNFSNGLDFLIKENNTLYIEIGSSKTLTSFLKQNKHYNSDIVSTSVLKHPKEEVDDISFLLSALGLLWAKGVDVKWNEYYFGEYRNKVSAPGYSFDKVAFPSRVNPIQKFIESSQFGINNIVSENYLEWIYEEGWKEIRSDASKNKSFDWTVCFLSETEFAEKLMNELISENKNTVFVKPRLDYLKLDENTIFINPSNIEDYQKLLSDISEKLDGTGRIIHAWCVGANERGLGDNKYSMEDLGYFSLLNIARSFGEMKNLNYFHLDFLVNDLFIVNGNEKISSIKATALGALKVIPKEYENIYSRCIEFLIGDFEKDPLYVNNLFSKLKKPIVETTIALRGSKIWKPFYEKVRPDKELLEDKITMNGLYVITGAYGGMGKILSDMLVNDYNADLILIGRGVENTNMMEKLRKENNSIYYIQDDLSDLSRLKEKVDSLMTDSNKALNGIFHAAGLGDYSGLITKRMKKDCQDIFLPKINGTYNLFNAFKSYSPDFIILCSSVASSLAPFGQVAYVAANLYQNFFAHEHNSKTKVVSIQFCAWKEIGMAITAANRLNKTNDSIVEFGIGNRDGLDLFKYALNSDSSEIIVSLRNFDTQLSMYADHTLKYFLDSRDQKTALNEYEVERPDMATPYIEARSETEKTMCELWKAVFGYEQIGVTDDFFALGGNSLKALALIKRIRKAFNIEISISDFFRKSNIRDLAKEINLALDMKVISGSVSQSKKSNQIRL